MKNLAVELNKTVQVFGKDCLRGAVAQSILDNSNSESDHDIHSFMSDVMMYGCISGCVSGMIYYTETTAFFDQFSEYLLDMLEEYDMNEHDELIFALRYAKDEEEIEELEEGLDISVDCEKNKFAWMMYEMIIGDLYNEFEQLLAV